MIYQSYFINVKCLWFAGYAFLHPTELTVSQRRIGHIETQMWSLKHVFSKPFDYPFLYVILIFLQFKIYVFRKFVHIALNVLSTCTLWMLTCWRSKKIDPDSCIIGAMHSYNTTVFNNKANIAWWTMKCAYAFYGVPVLAGCSTLSLLSERKLLFSL